MLRHDCPRCDCEVITYPKLCLRCGYKWFGPVEKPRVCPACKSPYWHRARSAIRYPEIYNLKPGETIIIPWPENHNGRAHPAIAVAKKLRAQGRQISIHKFLTSGAVVERSPDDVLGPDEITADNDFGPRPPDDKLI